MKNETNDFIVGGKKVESTNFIANYELNEYTYDQFWNGRKYEHLSEVWLLSRLLKKYVSNQQNKSIIDLGGAYGRLAPLYKDGFKRFILADYSTRELGKAKKDLEEYSSKMDLVGLNVYHLPFQDNSLDSALSVRLIHHIAKPEIFLSEVFRVLKPGGTFILEAAHKQHVLAFFKALFTGKMGEYLKNEPYRIEHRYDSQGMKEGQISIIYSFPVKYIQSLGKKAGFEIESTRACSFLRSTLLKKIFPPNVLFRMEQFFQFLLGYLPLTPSIVYVFVKPEDSDAVIHDFAKDPVQFQCPSCSKQITLSREETKACAFCKHEYKATNGIFDLREPRPEEVTF